MTMERVGLGVCRPFPAGGNDGNWRQGRASSRRRLPRARPASRICGLQRRAIIIPNRGKRFHANVRASRRVTSPPSLSRTRHAKEAVRRVRFQWVA